MIFTKKKIDTFIAICLFLMSLSIAVAAPDESIFLPYENLDYGIAIHYPEDWSLQENVMGTTALFFSPLTDETDPFRDNVNIIIQNLSAQPLTLEQYTALSLDQIHQYFTDVTVLASGKTRIAGGDAYMVVYTGKQGQFQLKWKQVWLIQNNMAYIISYTAQERDYDRYLESVDYLMNSFEITD